MTGEAPEWLSLAVWQRAGGMCERCRRRPCTDRSHRIARSRGGWWALWNIDGLCRGCHEWAERNPAAAEAAAPHPWRIPGRIVRGRYEGPWPWVAELVADGVLGDVEPQPRILAGSWWPSAWGAIPP